MDFNFSDSSIIDIDYLDPQPGDQVLNILGTGGFVVPAGTTGERPTGENGMLRYNGTNGQLEAFVNGTWTNLSNQSSGGTSYFIPGGRVTLTTATPVQVADNSGTTSIFYTPHVHDGIQLYNGSTWDTHTFTELTNATADTTKNPAAVAADNNYDLFVWDDASTIRLSRGPAWTSATARGTGAGTTELARQNGRFVNAVAITNGPAAGRGHYVGTFRSNASSQARFTHGGTAAGGTEGFLHVFNRYNQVLYTGQSRNSTNTWTYSGSVWRAANASNTTRINVLNGLDDNSVFASYSAIIAISSSEEGYVGVGHDSTTAPSGVFGTMGDNDIIAICTAFFRGRAGLGHHFFQALENRSGSSNPTFYGDNGGTNDQSGLQVDWWG